MAQLFERLKRDFSSYACEEAVRRRLDAWNSGKKDAYVFCPETRKTPEVQYSEEFRSYHLWKRLYGNAIPFNGYGPEYSAEDQYYYFPMPDAWKPYVKPCGPASEIGLDDWLEQLLAKGGEGLRSRLLSLGVDCPYWWSRWALFACGSSVDEIYRDCRRMDPKIISSVLEEIINLTEKASDSFEILHNLFLRSGISEVADDQRRYGAEGSNRYMHGIVEGGIYGAFDLNKISKIKDFSGVLLRSSVEWKSLINAKGRPSAVRRRAFAGFAGGIYYFLTGEKPTETYHGGFHDFLLTAERVFWGDWDVALEFPERQKPGTSNGHSDVKHLIGEVAGHFDGFNYELGESEKNNPGDTSLSYDDPIFYWMRNLLKEQLAPVL
ncbi:Uncharacterised protein [Pannonibacter phragmitetus]|uniref:Uncharacterized protein n=1 Tax=Pannonibacter phragmitetus TaxID=121719 RepID=A0A378ZTP6_9HYPH|nr:hypothetical protein [Pannonibacter phragmitetus]SUB00547.1 Uncharacterised protein [Pannonibacter phragmitetus]